MNLSFSGPFSWGREEDAECIFDAPQGKLTGIYLWTNGNRDRELVYYVGKTRSSFAFRMQDHLAQQASGMYHIHDPQLFRQGKKRCIWAGRYGRTAEPGGLMEFLDRMPEFYEAMRGFIRTMRFHLAPLDCPDRMLRRIEGALASHFWSLEPECQIQDEGVVYHRRRSTEQPIEVIVSSSRPIVGLPVVIEA